MQRMLTRELGQSKIVYLGGFEGFRKKEKKVINSHNINFGHQLDLVGFPKSVI